MSEYSILIREWATDLPRGHNTRTVCPFCAAHHEKSFSITRDFEAPWKIWFKCWRGTCAQHGYVEDKTGAAMVLWMDERERIPNKPLPEYAAIPERLLETLTAKYHISPQMFAMQGARYAEHMHTLCMPWLDEKGYQIGWVEKRFDGWAHKSHHDLCDRSAPGRLCFPRIGQSYLNLSTCVLVESVLDAYRVSETAMFGGYGIHAVALLGAQISTADARRLTEIFDKVVICLDPDQWPAGAIRVMQAFKPLDCQVRATTMDTDPKDSSQCKLDSLIDRIEEMF